MSEVRTPGPGDNLVAISPHLDDVVLSVGATLAHLAHTGVRVRVLTVFSGDPDQERVSGASNRRAGFATTGEASRVRRREDDEACARLGLHAVRLPFDDDEASARDLDAIRVAVEPHVSDADFVLIPGSPLLHPDHLLVSRLVVARLVPARTAALYLEQPYATWQALSRSGGISALRSRTTPPMAPSVDAGPVEWGRPPSCRRCRVDKLAAMGAYRSQLKVLRRWPRGRIAAYELMAGGERIAWPVGR